MAAGKDLDSIAFTGIVKERGLIEFLSGTFLCAYRLSDVAISSLFFSSSFLSINIYIWLSFYYRALKMSDLWCYRRTEPPVLARLLA